MNKSSKTFQALKVLGIALSLAGFSFAATPWKGAEPFSGACHGASHYRTAPVQKADALARVKLDKAIEQGQRGDLIGMRDALVQVVRDFPFTASAAEAALRIGSFEVELANPDEALPALLFLVNQHFYSPSGPEGALLLARALAEYGDLALAQKVLGRVASEATKKRIPEEYLAKSKETLEAAKLIARH